MSQQNASAPVSRDDAGEILVRYRAYCDACQSGELEKVPSFWSLPALFTVDTGSAETLSLIIETPDKLIEFYSQLFGSSTGVDKTLIDQSEVVFYGKRLATIKTELRHMVGDKLHDHQSAIYGCRKLGNDWIFTSHLSVDSLR